MVTKVATKTGRTYMPGDIHALQNKIEDFGIMIDSDLDDATDYETVKSVFDEYVEEDTTITVGTENFEFDDNVIDVIDGTDDLILGYHQINDFSFLGCEIGGDSEEPVYCIIYMNSKGGLSSYIPLTGNNFNETNMKAYPAGTIGTKISAKLLLEDITIAFGLAPAVLGTTASFAVKTEEEVITEEIKEKTDKVLADLEETIEAAASMSDEVVESILKEGYEDAKKSMEEFSEEMSKKVWEAVKDEHSGALKILDLERQIKDLTLEVSRLRTENTSLKTAASAGASTEEKKAIDEITKIISALSSGSTIPTSGGIMGGSMGCATPVAPAPKKELKKITLPTMTSSFKYVFGVENNAGNYTLHIVKEDDWNATKDLSKEGRVDVKTINILKASVPFKRDRFVYNLTDDYTDVKAVIKAVEEVEGISMTYSEELQKVI